MDKIIGGILTVVYMLVVTVGGSYTLKSVYQWSRNAAFEKIAQGLPSLEKATQIMTGEKADY